MQWKIKQTAMGGILLGLLSMAPVGLLAQASVPAKGNPESYADSPSKWDIFAGYSYLAPHGTTSGGSSASAVNFGAIVSVSRYFNKYVGVQLEGQEHIPNENPLPPYTPYGQNSGATWSNNDFSGGSAGLVFRFPGDEVTPFAHALVGGEFAGILPGTKGDKWGALLTVGGGLDYQTPLLHHKLAVRLFQADYQYTHINWGPLAGRGNFNMVQLSAGVVYHIGSIVPPAPITLACAASPVAVYPGDPVTVTATVGSVYGKLVPSYTWSGTGATGTDATATIATASLAPGSYTVNGAVKEGEGKKPWQTATCSATFTVKEFEPPTVSCSVTPTTIKPGDSATVTATGMSPQNRPLTYAYTASAGTVTGSGTTATYTSAGAPTGPVTITGTVTDDKGKTATCQTGLTIEAPAPPPAPHVQTLCSITFDKDKGRPTRVDNEAKACLDQVALSLQNQSDAKAVVVGEATSEEKEPKKGRHHEHDAEFAAQRAVDTKEYLVVDKGIDASRISVATGTTDSKSVENYLVPAGADFGTDVPGTTPVDESTVKPIERKPLAERHHHKKAM